MIKEAMIYYFIQFLAVWRLKPGINYSRRVKRAFETIVNA
jgi:hypothetical protein